MMRKETQYVKIAKITTRTTKKYVFAVTKKDGYMPMIYRKILYAAEENAEKKQSCSKQASRQYNAGLFIV